MLSLALCPLFFSSSIPFGSSLYPLLALALSQWHALSHVRGGYADAALLLLCYCTSGIPSRGQA